MKRQFLTLLVIVIALCVVSCKKETHIQDNPRTEPDKANEGIKENTDVSGTSKFSVNTDYSELFFDYLFYAPDSCIFHNSGRFLTYEFESSSLSMVAMICPDILNPETVETAVVQCENDIKEALSSVYGHSVYNEDYVVLNEGSRTNVTLNGKECVEAFGKVSDSQNGTNAVYTAVYFLTDYYGDHVPMVLFSLDADGNTENCTKLVEEIVKTCEYVG